jgi:thiamine pyrophosphate-dependent acetolactate synthase large subunit-like protein
MNGGGAIAEVLRREGTTQIFCFPSNPLIDSIADADIRPVMARVERVLLNMADGYTRASNARQIGVVVTQGGPGIENAFGGVAQAYADATPLLILPGGTSRARVSLPATFDAVANYQHITKFADRFATARQIPSQLRRAYALLRAGRPAPVLMEVPSDVQVEELDDAEFAYDAVRPLRGAGAPDDIRHVVRLLLAAQNPLLHVGQEVLWAEATAELIELAELLQAPVMTTMTGKSAMPEDHPLAIGVGAVSVGPAVQRLLPSCDLLFSIGADLARTLGSVGIPRGGQIVQCTGDERALYAEYPLAGAVIGDPGLVLPQLIDAVRAELGVDGRRGANRTASAIADLKRRGLEEWAPKLTSDATPISPFRVVHELNRALDKANSIITHDSGYPRDHLAPFYEATTPRGYLGWGNTTPLGSSLGLAMGAKLAQPHKLVVNVIGDTGFGQVGMDIETATREHLPILTVILNNSRMAGYDKKLPIAQRKFNVNRMTGDYTGVARALGAYAEQIDDPNEICAGLTRAQAAIAEGRTAVLELITAEDTVYPRVGAGED